jgi:hypothetical protein
MNRVVPGRFESHIHASWLVRIKPQETQKQLALAHAVGAHNDCSAQVEARLERASLCRVRRGCLRLKLRRLSCLSYLAPRFGAFVRPTEQYRPQHGPIMLNGVMLPLVSFDGHFRGVCRGGHPVNHPRIGSVEVGIHSGDRLQRTDRRILYALGSGTFAWTPRALHCYPLASSPRFDHALCRW